MIDLIKHFTPKNVSFYILGDFNFQNIDWSIPCSTFNECDKSFIKFCSENFLTQIIDSPTHNDGGILDLVLCNYIGLNRIKSHSVDSPLTNTNDHSLISFDIIVDKSIKSAAVTLYPAFSRADFKCINEYLSKIDWKFIYNKSENLQEFYDEFVNIINLAIKKFVPLKKKNIKRKIYPSNLKKLLKEKQKLYKKCKLDQQITKKYKLVSKAYQKAVKNFDIQHEKSFCQNTNSKKFYSFVKSKLNLAPTFPLLLNENNLPLTSDFDKASCFNKSFQKVFSKDYEDENFKLVDKNCPEMQDFFISNNEIIESINHLKDKILRTAENIPSYFLKRTICSLIFPISLIFN